MAKTPAATKTAPAAAAPAAAAASTAVVPAASNVPALASMFEEDAGSGFENADANAFAIPFLSILQKLSPQCDKKEGAYIEDAEEGMFFNTVTQEISDGEDGLEVVPIFYRRSFLEWAPRNSGGGFKGEHKPSDPIVNTTVKGEKGDVLPNGNLLVDTRIHYVFILKADGSYAPAVISMSSTQVKKSRQWMSKMDGIKFKNGAGELYTPPMYATVFRLTSVPESNDQGGWMGWKIETVRTQADPKLFAACKEFKRQIAAGEVKDAPPPGASEQEVPDEF